MNAEKLDATLLKLKEKIGIHQRLRLTTQLIDSMQAGLPEKLNLAWPNLELCQDDQLKNIIITVCQRSVLIVFFFIICCPIYYLLLLIAVLSSGSPHHRPCMTLVIQYTCMYALLLLFAFLSLLSSPLRLAHSYWVIEDHTHLQFPQPNHPHGDQMV